MNDAYYMNLALQLAKSVQGQTTPNPPVGAVIVKNGAIVGMGAHLKSGESHAEIIALNMAGNKAKGATMYVTLEPCSHTGKTPPCADSIIRQQMKRVVVASKDWHNQVAGKGIKRLQAAGIDVEQGVLSEEADALYEVFFHYISRKFPYVTLKTAMTLDGKIATETGDSKWITGDAAREDVHVQRHVHDAILIGVGTVIADNPQLTTRLAHGKNPLRVILDTHLRTPIDAKVVIDGQASTWIFVNKAVSQERIAMYESFEQVSIIVLDSKEIEIKRVLEHLGRNDITSVFVEGGASIHGAFLDAGYLNQFIGYIAPKCIGGTLAKTAVGGVGVRSIAEAYSLEILSVEMIGEDIKIIAKKGDA